MGKKTSSRKISTLKRMSGILIGCLLLTGIANPVLARTSSSRLALQFDYQMSKDSLTTEKVWALDPKQTNPHRQRWVLYRNTELIGLKAVRNSEKNFGL